MKFTVYLEIKFGPKSIIIHARRGDEHFQQESVFGYDGEMEELNITREKLKDQIIAAHGFIDDQGNPLTVELVGGS